MPFRESGASDEAQAADPLQVRDAEFAAGDL